MTLGSRPSIGLASVECQLTPLIVQTAASPNVYAYAHTVTQMDHVISMITSLSVATMLIPQQMTTCLSMNSPDIHMKARGRVAPEPFRFAYISPDSANCLGLVA